MPLQQILPTWVALNNGNFTSPTGITDLRTGQPFAAGGLNLGDYFDVTNMEAAGATDTANGTLYEGRYRFVQVDSGATSGNVATGLVGYVTAGKTVAGVVVLTQGSGQTPGTYLVSATGGGGTGAIIQVVVLTATSITATVVNPGFGYTSVPTFTLATGGTPGTVAAQLSSTPNQVTSYDKAIGTVRPVVFLNSITPGNYGFVQELGLATVLGNGTIGTAAVQNFVNATTGGTVNAGTTYTVSTIGQAADLPVASNLFKVYLSGPTVQD
jgi:hypothetical protein